MNTYIFKIKHDHGIVLLRILSDSISKAVAIVLNTEGCPERAILNIKIKYHG